jgi:release factor glutamine methyltransferase
LGAWLINGRKTISVLKEEHSSSLYALATSILKQPASWVLSHSEYQLAPEEEDTLNTYLSRLVSREPLAYITGIQSFFGLEFNVTPHVLIPRPATELLVEQAIQAAGLFQRPFSIADVGTGSGCISISLAKSLSSAQIIATDISFNALRIAKENIQYHQVEKHIHLVQASLLAGIQTKFHIICANLPYIPTGKLSELPILNYEPRIALDGGKDGLIFIRQLFQGIQVKLHAGGVVIIEIEHTQESRIINICKQLLPSASCTILNDLAGLPRAAVIRMDG